MPDLDRDIDAAIATADPIPRERVLAWIDAATDLSTLAKLYRLTGEAYYRIQPDLGKDMTCKLIQQYLLECIRRDIKDDEQIQDRWAAARTLHAWFCHLGEAKDTTGVLTNASQAITELFLTSGPEIRTAIEQGFLEHALEMESLRPYFEHWSSDGQLREAWARAMEWGRAHPNYTWQLLQDLQRKIRSKT